MVNYRQDKASLIFDVVNHLLLCLFFVITLYPFYYIFIYSISDPIEAQKGIVLLPTHITLNNYVQIFRLKGLLNATVVSVLRTVIGPIITIACSSFFAYLVTKEEMRFRKIVYRFVVISMYLNAGLIPWYLVMRMYHLNNTFFLYVIPGAISPYYIILMKTFMEQLPASLEEAARIDGAGYFTVFTRIIFPLSKPIIATVAVFAAVAAWNTWFDNFFLVQDPQLKTLQLVLREYLLDASRVATASMEQLSRGEFARMTTPTTIRMTITMVVTFPILFVYPYMQKHFVKGIMLGAIKG